MKPKFKTGVVLFDIHYPEHDNKCLNIALQVVKDIKPSFFILGGDQLDMSCISSFNKRKPLLLENNRLKRDYNGFQQMMNVFIASLPRRCEKVFMIGNHEYRVNRLIESDPQYQGFIEIENNLDLKDWKVIPFNHLYSVGFLNIIHGIFWNIHHAKKHLLIYGDNLYYGHTHTSQSWSQQTPLNNEPKEARGVGCLCNKNPDWKKDRPNNWIHEFLVFEVLPSGVFFPHVLRIIEGRCIFNGKVYKG